MFKNRITSRLHTEAVNLVIKNLPGAVDMDSVAGYYAPYDIEWNNIKILIKVARLSNKEWQPKMKWYYTLREKDHQICDFFILFALAEEKIVGLYVLPRAFVPSKTITITKQNGEMRYQYFRASIGELSQKITEIQVKLPKLVKIFNEAKSLRGGNL